MVRVLASPRHPRRRGFSGLLGRDSIAARPASAARGAWRRGSGAQYVGAHIDEEIAYLHCAPSGSTRRASGARALASRGARSGFRRPSGRSPLRVCPQRQGGACESARQDGSAKLIVARPREGGVELGVSRSMSCSVPGAFRASRSRTHGQANGLSSPSTSTMTCEYVWWDSSFCRPDRDVTADGDVDVARSDPAVNAVSGSSVFMHHERTRVVGRLVVVASSHPPRASRNAAFAEAATPRVRAGRPHGRS